MCYNLNTVRSEPYGLDDYVHVIKRGVRGLPIVKNEHDRHRFLLMLRHLNDRFYPEDWFDDLRLANLIDSFERPDFWPPQKPLVGLVCFCLLNNHFHLLLHEITPGGISKFMQRLGTSMARHFNAKYQEQGALFQSAYRSRTINDEDYLGYVSAYIQVKNCFELYPDCRAVTLKNFDQLFAWAEQYPDSSLGETTGYRPRLLTTEPIISEMFAPKEYKEFCRDFIIGRNQDEADELIAFE